MRQSVCDLDFDEVLYFLKYFIYIQADNWRGAIPMRTIVAEEAENEEQSRARTGLGGLNAPGLGAVVAGLLWLGGIGRLTLWEIGLILLAVTAGVALVRLRGSAAPYQSA